MSINLTLTVDGKEENLYQTPTIVTYAILYKNGYLFNKIDFDKNNLIKDSNKNIIDKYCF